MHREIAMSLSRIGTLAAFSLLAAPAWSTPVSLPVGGMVSPVPTYTGTGKPTATVLADTGLQTQMQGGITVEFEEVALDTSLNPGGVSFAFALLTSNNPTSLSAALPGFSALVGGLPVSTSVESCDPFAVMSTPVTVCGEATGTAARSGAPGDVVTFSAIGSTPVSGPVTLYLSNVYGVFTNAPGFVDPHVTVSDNGSIFTFNGIAPSGTKPAPEPGTLTLLALGLVGGALARRRRS
jgi:hypothetical protein